MTDGPVLSLRGVSKRFGRRLVLDALDLEVRPGEVHGFLGPNGAGKTTTIRIATGLIRASSGEVRLFDRDPRHPAARGRMGAVVEIPTFYAYLSGLENLRVLARLSGIRDAAPVREALGLVEMDSFGRQKVGTYSQGMRQRLGIAQALLGWPDLVVLDEPTNGLDPRGIREVRRLILKVNRERGITFLISSHLLHEVELLCNRVSIIHAGRLVEAGDTDDLLEPEPDYFIVGVDDPERATELLGKNGFTVEPERIGPGMIRVRTGGRSIAEANGLLVREGLRVEEIRPVRPTLEDHFLRRVGQEDRDE